MPTGHHGEGKTFSKKLGKWLTTKKERAYDYDALTEEQRKSAGLIISFFRWYPDYFYDLIRSPQAKYKMEFIQRILLRLFARYGTVYITGARGLTKTYNVMLSKSHDGLFFPGEKMRYVAPAQKQSAKLASDAFKSMCSSYPIMTQWWDRNNDRGDMFRMSTIYGSEFTMYAPRGDNSSSLVAEEMAQEGGIEGFDFETFDNDITPMNRLERTINGKQDRTHINFKESYISNAASRQNKAFTKYRAVALKTMLFGGKYKGYCIDIPWEVALLCNIRSQEYYEKERAKSTGEKWLREMCARYTGSIDNPMINDEVLSKSRKNLFMEECHCGDTSAIYIVSHDVSYVDSAHNAKCADVVLKLTKYEQISRRDKFRAQVVYVDAYPPPATAYLQAQRLKNLWRKYTLDGAQPTYLVVDAHAYGSDVVEELMKPTNDGTRPLCCLGHSAFTHVEQPNALPIIYPLKAGTKGTKDEDAGMIAYAQLEFEQGYIELLTGNILDGVEQYKLLHNIKDDKADARIALPYKKNEEMCGQIANLQTKASGLTVREVRKSMSIQRDIWSALKYALRMTQILEDDLKKDNYKKKSSWAEAIAGKKPDAAKINTQNSVNTVNRLLALKRGF